MYVPVEFDSSAVCAIEPFFLSKNRLPILLRALPRICLPTLLARA